MPSDPLPEPPSNQNVRDAEWFDKGWKAAMRRIAEGEQEARTLARAEVKEKARQVHAPSWCPRSCCAWTCRAFSFISARARVRAFCSFSAIRRMAVFQFLSNHSASRTF